MLVLLTVYASRSDHKMALIQMSSVEGATQALIVSVVVPLENMPLSSSSKYSTLVKLVAVTEHFVLSQKSVTYFC